MNPLYETEKWSDMLKYLKLRNIQADRSELNSTGEDIVNFLKSQKILKINLKITKVLVCKAFTWLNAALCYIKSWSWMFSVKYEPWHGGETLCE